MAKNRLLFSTPINGVSLRPGTSELITGRHHHCDDDRHDHHDHDHHDRDHHRRNHHHRRHRHRHDHHGRRGGIDVREFETIRVVADNRRTSVSTVFLVLLVSGRREREERDGRNRNVQEFRLAKIRLVPGQSFSQAYRVPGEVLNIVAFASRSRRSCFRGFSTIDVAVFGHK